MQVQLRLLDGVNPLRWWLRGACAEQSDHRQDLMHPLSRVRKIEGTSA